MTDRARESNDRVCPQDKDSNGCDQKYSETGKIDGGLLIEGVIDISRLYFSTISLPVVRSTDRPSSKSSSSRGNTEKEMEGETYDIRCL